MPSHASNTLSARTRSEELDPEPTPERITAALTNKVSSQLNRLRTLTGMSKTDLVNRAVSLYYFVEQVTSSGKQLAVYDPDKQEFELVHIT